MRKILNILQFLLVTFMLLVMLYFGSRIFIADQFIIPTWSMAPTLVPGDRVVVNKLAMGARIYTDFDFHEGGQELKSVRMKGLRGLRHNDIVVFNNPQVGERIAFKINLVYCKRCVALPGTRIQRRKMGTEYDCPPFCVICVKKIYSIMRLVLNSLLHLNRFV